MTALKLSTLHKELKPAIDKVYGGLKGNHTLDDQSAAINKLLLTKDLNKYRGEVARQIAVAEDHSRKSTQIPKQNDLFTREVGDRVLLSLGGGKRVKLSNATWQDYEIQAQLKRKHRQEAASAEVEWLDFMEEMRLAGAEKNRKQTTEESKIILGHWSERKDHTDE